MGQHDIRPSQFLGTYPPTTCQKGMIIGAEDARPVRERSLDQISQGHLSVTRRGDDTLPHRVEYSVPLTDLRNGHSPFRGQHALSPYKALIDDDEAGPVVELGRIIRTPERVDHAHDDRRALELADALLNMADDSVGEEALDPLLPLVHQELFVHDHESGHIHIGRDGQGANRLTPPRARLDDATEATSSELGGDLSEGECLLITELALKLRRGPELRALGNPHLNPVDRPLVLEEEVSGDAKTIIGIAIEGDGLGIVPLLRGPSRDDGEGLLQVVDLRARELGLRKPRQAVNNHIHDDLTRRGAFALSWPSTPPSSGPGPLQGPFAARTRAERQKRLAPSRCTV